MNTGSQTISKLFGGDGYVTRARRQCFAVLEAVLFTLVMGVLTVVIIQVVARYMFKVSTPWTDEVSQILLVWTVMVGAAVAMERKEHYVITFIFDRVPRRIRLALLVSINLVAAIFLLLLADIGWDYFHRGFGRNYIVTGVPHAATFLSLPVAAVMMLFSMVSQSLEVVVDHREVKVRRDEEVRSAGL